MKTKLVQVFICVMVFVAIGGCSRENEASEENRSNIEKPGRNEETKIGPLKNTDISENIYAIITKSAGNPYNEKEAAGFQEVIEEKGGVCIVIHPEKATAEEQITIIDDLVSQNVKSIAIAGNDVDALQTALAKAMELGIKVSALDSTVNAKSRMTFVNPASTEVVGETLMEAVHDMTKGSGQWAILSATSQAVNQNAWITYMKEVMFQQKYKELKLVDIVYGDDDYQKSMEKTRYLLENYPDLKVICAPTVVGIAAAAEVVQNQGLEKQVKVTGLGLPSEMEAYIGANDSAPCPYMFLWNPIDMGRLSAYVSMALVDETITGELGESFKAGNMGNFTVQDAKDGGTQVIVGPLLRFDAENIDEWKMVY